MIGPLKLQDHMWHLIKHNLQYYTSFFDTTKHTRRRMPRNEKKSVLQKVYADIASQTLYLSQKQPSNIVSVKEYGLLALVITAAILNPYMTPWDVKRYAEKVKISQPNVDNPVSTSDLELEKYFKSVHFGDINVPAVFIDCHGLIMAWYLPGALTQSRLMDYNNSVKGLTKLLTRSLETITSWRGKGFLNPGPSRMFQPGVVDFSPGWFMSRKERLIDDIYVSTGLRSEEGARFIQAISPVEIMMNAALASCAPELFAIGTQAIELLKEGNFLHAWHENVNLWPSAFSGIEAIVNRSTPAHRDPGASYSVFDLLVSAGTHSSSIIRLCDIHADLEYQPGTVVLLCGRVLKHEVLSWNGGERICIAHYMRDNVHQRLKLSRPDWVDIDSYRNLMASSFYNRQYM